MFQTIFFIILSLGSHYISMLPAPAVPSGEGTEVPYSFADLVERLKPTVINISTTKTISTYIARSTFRYS